MGLAMTGTLRRARGRPSPCGELERDGLVAARPGVGTFITRTLADSSLAAHEPLRRDLARWLGKARAAGLDEESIEALFMSTFRAVSQEIA
jgi:GntR family transcriptional regulator